MRNRVGSRMQIFLFILTAILLVFPLLSAVQRVNAYTVAHYGYQPLGFSSFIVAMLLYTSNLEIKIYDF
jgi:hypothetical protein